MSDGQRRMNPNPLSDQEIRDLARSGKPSHMRFSAFSVAKRVGDGNDLLDLRITQCMCDGIADINGKPKL